MSSRPLQMTFGFFLCSAMPQAWASSVQQFDNFNRLTSSWAERLCQISEEHPDRRLRVNFQDKSRFGQQGTTTNVWAKTNSRPTAVRQTESVGPGCGVPRNGSLGRSAQPALNTVTINKFLKLFSESIPDGEHAVMVWDRASFHAPKSLKMPAYTTPVQAPPYSPELNPIENMWHYLKSHRWGNRAYKDYDELESSAMVASRQVVIDEPHMKTVCNAQTRTS